MLFKSWMTIIAMTFSFAISADVLESSEISENDASIVQEDLTAGYCSDQQLRRVKEAILSGRYQAAVRMVDRMIQNNGGDNPQTFAQYGIVYNQKNVNFRCNRTQERRALRLAADGAMSRCQRMGYRRCRVERNGIRINGYIGTVNGQYYGYGCLAEAVVRGSDF